MNYLPLNLLSWLSSLLRECSLFRLLQLDAIWELFFPLLKLFFLRAGVSEG